MWIGHGNPVLCKIIWGGVMHVMVKFEGADTLQYNVIPPLFETMN